MRRLTIPFIYNTEMKKHFSTPEIHTYIKVSINPTQQLHVFAHALKCAGGCTQTAVRTVPTVASSHSVLQRAFSQTWAMTIVIVIAGKDASAPSAVTLVGCENIPFLKLFGKLRHCIGLGCNPCIVSTCRQLTLFVVSIITVRMVIL